MARGIVRTITHWTAGSGRASALDKQHYHRITEADGTVVDGKEEVEDNIVVSDGDYAAHTLNLNTGSAGFAMAGMRGAEETSPVTFGPDPITETQFEAHCRMLADFHLDWNIPVTRKTCLTHSEVQPTLGVRQRGKWDINFLKFKPELHGPLQVGDYMRDRVRAYLGSPPEVRAYENRPTLREGAHGAFVLDLQTMLRDLGFHHGKLDGQFGGRTKEAVAAFQTHERLVADGVVGPNTWAALLAAEPKPKRDVTKADLKKQGSRTMNLASLVKMAGVGTAGAGGAASVVKDAVTARPEELSNVQTNLGAVNQIVADYWPLGLAVLAAVGLFVLAWRMEWIRLDEAQSGENLSK